ncbi:MAG: DUF4215 domain-containing protein [Deltaproteobacteria bacterium]|nr:DUF4215 domain-containing protein [Deltaproteobacteria bacterium]
MGDTRLLRFELPAGNAAFRRHAGLAWLLIFLVVGCAAGASGSATSGDAGRGRKGGDGGDSDIGGSGIPSDLEKCGNGRQDGNEQCDDGNSIDTDGCNRLCQIAADYECPEWGKPCINKAVCGDGLLSSSEACDDGNTISGDGCSADCSAVETGWRCRAPGKRCTSLCGDGFILPEVENCDDGNDEAGDGCSATCLIEPGYSCEGAPSVCTAAECGNGVLEAGESCDLGDGVNGLFHGDGTGCSRTCTQEPTCRDADGVTQACVTRCGDGNVDIARGETCDDANGVSGDGCSADCQKEEGFNCTEVEKKDAQSCNSGSGECLQLPITYRDFDGAHMATGHPDFLYYGSTPAGGTRTVCVPNSSGIPERARTDGGTCWAHDSSALCLGLTKPELDTDGKPAANTARAGGLTCPCRYTDWDKTGILAGLTTTAQYTIGTCFAGGSGTITSIEHKGVQVIQSAQSFKQWYADSDYSTKSVGFLELDLLSEEDNTYQFTANGGRTLYDDIHDIWMVKTNQPDAPADGATSLTSGFFPLESASGTHATKLCNLWPYWALTDAESASCVRRQYDQRADTNPNNPGAEGQEVADVQGVMRNYYFTTEARYLFRYQGGEVLSFHGDDDVWVFVNGRLVLDMGSTHERLEGTVTLSDAGAEAVLRSQDSVTMVFTQVGDVQTTADLGLEEGNTYEIAIFHADHHPRDSNYQLTLTGFSRTVSECQPACGDGVITVGEECDDGALNADGVYGACTTECVYGPFCGDGRTDAPDEECDDGRDNTAGYGSEGCTPGCKRAHFCGDGFLDSAEGEACDAGPSASDICDATCHIIIK